MRLLEHKGIKIYLTEYEVRKIVDSFTPPEDPNLYLFDRSCIICKEYRNRKDSGRDCLGCPFDSFRPHSGRYSADGCLKFLKDILGYRYYNFSISTHLKYIYWDKEKGLEAREELKKIREYFSNLPKGRRGKEIKIGEKKWRKIK